MGVVSVLTLLVSSCSGAGPQSALEPQGEIARQIDGLWLLVFWLATAVFAIVTAAYLISIFRFRERKGRERAPKQIHGNTRLEIIWTIIPAVILATIAVPTVSGIFDVRSVPEGADVLQVRVTGHQWWWEFEYSDFRGADGTPVVTANELHIPAGRKVNLTMTSVDVIHSFWVPPLNGKRDVVPGRITNLTLEADNPTPPGEPIFGQCAEFCGLAHADMRIKVFVDSEADFQAWLDAIAAEAAIPAEGTVAAAGWETFNLVCTACHQATVRNTDGAIETVGPYNTIETDGVEFRASYGPNLTHFGARDYFAGASLTNTRDHLEQWLANPSSLKPMEPDRNDIPNKLILGMPNFNLNQNEIDGLIALLEGWGIE